MGTHSTVQKQAKRKENNIVETTQTHCSAQSAGVWLPWPWGSLNLFGCQAWASVGYSSIECLGSHPC